MPSLEENLAALPRHERIPDLLAHASDKHVKKTRTVEWVGEANPMDNPLVAFRVVMGLYTPLQEQAIRKAAAHARTRGGHSAATANEAHRIRLLENDHQGAQMVFKGLSQTYIFSPKNNYIQEVTYRDFDVIFSSNVAHEFRDLEDPNRPPPPWESYPSEDSIARIIRQDRVPVDDPDTGILAKT